MSVVENIVVVMIVVEKSVVAYILDSCNLGSRIVDFDDTPIVIDKHVRAVTFAFHKGEMVATSLSVGNLGRGEAGWLLQVARPRGVVASEVAPYTLNISSIACQSSKRVARILLLATTEVHRIVDVKNKSCKNDKIYV
ncbi:hypothetical protein Tco_0835620 [Tanacetum coccineum]